MRLGSIADPSRLSAGGTVTTERARVTIVLPCLNEGAGLRAMAATLESAFSGDSDHQVTALFVDDGSTDETWQTIQELAKTRREIRYRGLRLRDHRGKAAALAVGIRDAVAASDYVAVMDSDGQHDPSVLPTMVRSSVQTARPVIAARTDYRRGTIPRLGTAGLGTAARVLGVTFDPALSEFMVLPVRVAQTLTASTRLGFLPLVPLVQALKVEYDEQPVKVLPRNGTDPRTRWGLADLWHKAIMHLLVDPWSLLPRITFLIAGLVVVLGGYGLAVGIWSMVQGTFLGIGSVLVAVVMVFAALAALMCVTLGVAVVSYQSTAGLATQPGIEEEAA
jgi:hypothetical protein